ncbi:MAG: MFS transporter [Angustibacter sp.]
MSFVADLRTVVAGRDFRRLFAVRLTSQAADGAFQTALASVVFFSPERAATPQAAAVAFAVTVLPYTLIGPFTGVLLDRWRRRQVLLVTNTVRAVMVLGIAAVLLTVSVGPALSIGVLTCLSVNRFFLVALGASLPHVVPEHRLVMANAVSPTCGTLAAIVGGGVAYLVRQILPIGDQGDAVLLSVAAAGYGVTAALSTRMRRDQLGPDRSAAASPGRLTVDQRADGWRAVAEGVRHVATLRPAREALIAIAVSRFGYGCTTIVTILLARNHFTAPQDVEAGMALLALAFAASGLGFATAALITPIGADRWGTSGWMWRCLVAGAVAQLLLVVHLTVPVALVAAVVLGAAVQGIKICVDATLQDVVTDGLRGRAFAAYDVVFNLAFVAAAAGAALVVPATGVAPGLAVGIAIGYLVDAFSLARPPIRSAAEAGTKPARPDQHPPANAPDAGPHPPRAPEPRG